MRIFLNKWFRRFALKEAISDVSLCDAVQRAARGLVDADLGGGVIKQRIARQGEGRSSGFRTVVIYAAGDRAFFVFGYAKSDRENITKEELKGFRELAKQMLNYDVEQLESAVRNETLSEVNCHE